MAGSSVDHPSFQCEEALRAFLDKQNDQRKDQDLAEHGADLRFEDLVGDPQAERGHYATGQLADTAEHDDQEGIDDVALAQVRADVADLAQRHAAQPGDAGAQAKREHVHAPGGHAAAGGHVAVLGDGAHVEAQARLVQQQPGQHHHAQGEGDDYDAVVRQHQVGQHLNAAGQPGGVGHFDVLRAEYQPDKLDQHQADAPGGEQGFQGAAVQVTNHRAFQGHADGGGDEKRHRQRDQRVELDGLRHVALHQQLHHVGGVGAEHQHLAVGHVDHAQQAERDRQAQGREQQDRTEGHAAEGLAEDLAQHQFAFDLGQAGLGGGMHRSVGFHAGGEQGFEAGAGQRVAGAAKQTHGG